MFTQTPVNCVMLAPSQKYSGRGGGEFDHGYLHPERRLRMHGAITSVLNTPQFMCLLISTETILRTFTFKNAHYLSLFSVE